MNDVLIVVDMQNDFIDGALGTSEALAILPNVKEKIEGFQGKVRYSSLGTPIRPTIWTPRRAVSCRYPTA